MLASENNMRLVEMHPTMGRYAGFIGLILSCIDLGYAAEQSEIDISINRGLTWIMEHPATCQDGGFLDLVDEGLFYLTIKRLSFNSEYNMHLEEAFEDCISRLESSSEFDRRLKKPNKNLIEYYHLLLASHIINTAGKQTPSRKKIIEDAQRTLEHNQFDNPTFELTVALLLQHSGARPLVHMDELLEASLINRVVRSNATPSSFQHPLVYYALVHEVAALTDFGRLPVSPWLMERRARIAQILHTGAYHAIMSERVDLLAEILLCSQMLALPVTGQLRAGVDFLVASQHTDGTWGEQTTVRSNRVRHAVQTATAALIAYTIDAPVH